MVVRGLHAISRAQNGVGAFILQCKRLEFNYCDFGGSSRGMKAFLRTRLATFAKENPQVEMIVAPRPHKHPIIRGLYINGREKVVCVRNLEVLQVLQKVELLRDASGVKLRKTNKPVQSVNASVRGIWSPYHATGTDVYKV
ncbi:hypothetical protein DRE_01754 [Drechslerella stenobrocha 248]|uniref:Large ribosomal subunit protein mL43 n=1 Tax=Drechslerella stenobrocha 248 TaxID=1043628 RepID=W7I900_9PEZI|nr:hypothetical protein DRE_01754 [Drechslerella stenobrocha 248]